MLFIPGKWMKHPPHEKPEKYGRKGGDLRKTYVTLYAYV